MTAAVLAGAAGIFTQANAADYSYLPTLGEDSGYTVKEVEAPTATSITTYEVIALGQTKAHYYEVIVKEGADVSSAVATSENLAPLIKDYIANTDVSLDYSAISDGQITIKGDYINNNNKIFNQSTSGNNGFYVNVQGNFIGNTADDNRLESLGIINNFSGNVYDNVGPFVRFESVYKISDSNFINNRTNFTLSAEEINNINNIITGESLMSEEGMVMRGGGAATLLCNSVVQNSYFEGNSTPYSGGAIINDKATLDSFKSTASSVGLTLTCNVAHVNVVDDNGTTLGNGYVIKTGGLGGGIYDSINNNQSFFLLSGEARIMLAGITNFSDDILEETVNISQMQGSYGNKIQEADLPEYLSQTPVVLSEYLAENDYYLDTTIINSSFVNNHAGGAEGWNAKGGAIYSQGDLAIIANEGKDVIFKDNYTLNNGVKDNNAIHMGSHIYITEPINKDHKGYLDIVPSTLNLKVSNGGRIFMYDKISGDNNGYHSSYNPGDGSLEKLEDTYEHYNINISGDKTGTVYLFNDIENGPNITLTDTNLYLGRDNVINNSALTLNSGIFNMVNNQVGISALNTLTVNADTDFVADVDLANKQMDRFTAKEYGKHTGNLNVSGMNLLSDATDPKTEIYFAQDGLKDNVTTTVTEVAYTPIYKYSIRYENRDDAGYFVFDRGGSNGGNSSEAFNPAVLSSPVSSVAAAQATINETFKYVFEHADAFTQLPSDVRTARINANKYALYDGASTDFNGNRGSLCYDHNNKAAWFRPYATFETMNLKNGPKVDAITYGSLAGFDTDFHEHKNGWHSVGTGYIGYNGSQLSYKGVDTTMNGGVLGYTHTMYKGNFWTALTLSAGASVGESRTMYGKEDFTSLMAGVGSKTGYNFEFKEGKYILQPIMFMSYTFVNTFDYTNAAGVKINADPAHSIQLNPSIRFISNFKNGWQPYASVGMVWNVMNENNVTANNVRLPEMSMKPYVEYGVGVQRNWKDKFTAFGQAMLRNGGRNGIALTAGFRWALGKDTPHHNDKVQAPKTDRTVLKQLKPQQKMALTGKKNTTITSAKAVLKQL